MSLSIHPILPDLHGDVHDPISLAAVEKYLQEGAGRWTRGAQLGDFGNFDCVSRHVKSDLRAQVQTSITEEADTLNRILDRWQKYVEPWDIIEGNHDARLVHFSKEHPQVGNALCLPRLLRLKERGINWVPFWTKGNVLKYGKANFVHGHYLNKHHASRMAEHYGCNIFYGHSHCVSQASVVLHGDNSTIVGQSLGTLSRYDLDYIAGRPTKWQQAFAVFYIQPNGFFNYYVIRIFDHAFVSPEGEVYDGKKIVRNTRRK